MSYNSRPNDPQNHQQDRLRTARERQRAEGRFEAAGVDMPYGRDAYDARESAGYRDERARRADNMDRADYANRQSFRNSRPSHYENTGNPDQDFYRGSYENDRDEFASERDSYSRRVRNALQEFDVDFGRGESAPALHMGKGPKNFQRRPERIQEDACERLEDHGDIDASEIEVGFQDGVLTLTGEVDSRRTKVRAEQCVENVRGVKDVMNQLSVDEGFFAKLKTMITGEEAGKS